MNNKPMPSAAALASSPTLPGLLRQPRDLSALTSDGAEGPLLDALQAPASITSAGGSLVFELKAETAGVHVMRIHRRDNGAKVYCSVLFESDAIFVEWLDADPLRFTHPLVFQQARRCFAQLMTGRVQHDAVRS